MGGYVRTLVVDKDFRRRGVATRLIDWSKDVAKEGGALQLYVHFNRNNEEAIALYQGTRFTFRPWEGDLLEASIPLRKATEGERLAMSGRLDAGALSGIIEE